MASMNDDKVLEKYSMLLWACWNMHNKSIFEHLVEDPCIVSNRAIQFLGDFQVAQAAAKVDEGVSRAFNVKWSATPSDVLKLNIDVAVAEGGSLVGVGVVLRNHEGQLLLSLLKKLNINVSVVIAEAIVAYEVCQSVRITIGRILSWKMTFMLINELHQRREGWLCFHQVIEDIFSICSSFSYLSFSFVK
ncbi:uncharacterized protein LOC125370953 [Ricinus communis]|uniref:uncharacterized protein LOC125370953 n=1 Tax=Ricinus communis TaxID=3988 RepID=UPI00201A68C4|nr:uncharacterized protein LOC125370953 [Ricinus communis]